MKLALAVLLAAGCATTTPTVPAPSAASGSQRVPTADTPHRVKHQRQHSPRVSRSLHRLPWGHNWSQVARCESGGNWQDTDGMFEGGLQFLHSTWVSQGGREFAEHAYDATEAQQIEVAERLLRTAGIGSWPTCGRWLRDAA